MIYSATALRNIDTHEVPFLSLRVPKIRGCYLPGTMKPVGAELGQNLHPWAPKSVLLPPALALWFCFHGYVKE